MPSGHENDRTVRSAGRVRRHLRHRLGHVLEERHSVCGNERISIVPVELKLPISILVVCLLLCDYYVITM